ncbi:hypothetical protein KUTeg_020774 [Tegillarca granosa]|uniref:Uncharacterized protein n=1 Tax=Tegillarca granosa TaxID=220873 RepID=A0ABQ9ED32_TEGGR|nr:hypothetical protein KUTeg_020774 [Tegillarca granosa]
MTIKEYELRKQEEKDPVTVEGVGLVIDKDEKYLAASPDGIISRLTCIRQHMGQLNICNMPLVDFVVRTEKPYQLHIERVMKDKTLCNNQMLPKLKAFYFNAVRPKLVYSTVNTVSGIKEPGQWNTQLHPEKNLVVIKYHNLDDDA